MLNGNGKGPPLVDEIARDPKLADDLAPSVVAALLGQAIIAVAALEARLLVASVATHEAAKPVIDFLGRLPLARRRVGKNPLWRAPQFTHIRAQSSELKFCPGWGGGARGRPREP